MAKFRVYVGGNIEAYGTVEAEDKDEAIEKLIEDIPNLCAGCSGWGRPVGLEINTDSWGEKYAEADELDE